MRHQITTIHPRSKGQNFFQEVTKGPFFSGADQHGVCRNKQRLLDVHSSQSKHGHTGSGYTTFHEAHGNTYG